MSSIQTTDDMVEAVVGKTGAPRITTAYLMSLIVQTEYWHPRACSHMTVCALTLKNGFTAVGHSAPADPKNFSEALGRELAREDALNKVWPLEGYLLRQSLHEKEEGA